SGGGSGVRRRPRLLGPRATRPPISDPAPHAYHRSSGGNRVARVTPMRRGAILLFMTVRTRAVTESSSVVAAASGVPTRCQPLQRPPHDRGGTRAQRATSRVAAARLTPRRTRGGRKLRGGGAGG